jgi:hypothetical protein
VLLQLLPTHQGGGNHLIEIRICTTAPFDEIRQTSSPD